MKRLFAVAGILFFLGLVVFYAPLCSYALNPQPLPPGLYPSKYIGTITKIDGTKITVMDDAGKAITIESNEKGLKVGDKVTVNNGNVTKSGNNSSLQPLYKDGEDGVNRTGTGKNKPGMNPSVKPLYKDGEDGVNRTNPVK